MTVILGYIDLDEHGGGCCGVTCMHNFPDLEDATDELGHIPTLKDKIDTIQTYLSNNRETMEVVLTQRQAKMWETALRRCGFKRVMEFSNPNTSNILRMYLSTRNQVKPVPRKRGEVK